MGKPTRRRGSRGKHHLRVGAPPGELFSNPEAAATQLRIIAYGSDALVETTHLDQVARLREEHPVVWVDVEGLADVETLRRLGELLSVHALALEDALNHGQRPKVERYADDLFIVLRPLNPGEGEHAHQLSFFLTAGLLVTVHDHAPSGIEGVRERLRNGRPRIRGSQADYLTYALIDAAIDHCYPVVSDVGGRLDQLEGAVLDGHSDQLSALAGLRQELIEIRLVLSPTRDALAQLLRPEMPQFRPTTEPFLRDCLDHTVRLAEKVNALHESAAAVMDLQIAMDGVRMNETMRTLTVIATIFMPLGFIAGLYGMNFERNSPFNMPELGWRYGYFYALGLMALFALAMGLFFVKRGWFKR